MFSKYGTIVFSFVLGIVLVAGLVAIPSTAQAQVSSNTPAQANPDPVDCSKGCTIITCGKITCTVWYCNAAQGCVIKGSYPNPGGNVVKNDSLEHSELPTIPERDDLAFAKVCSGNRCQLYELTPDKATKVGYVDNIDEIMKELRAKHAAGED